MADVHRMIEQRYVEPVNSDYMRLAAIQGMLAPLRDDFTQFYPPAQGKQLHDMLEGSYAGIGVRIERTPEGYTRVITPLENSPAALAHIEPQDIILTVDGQSIQNLSKDDVSNRIRGRPGTTVLLGLRSPEGLDREVSVQRATVIDPVTLGYQRGPDNTWRYFIDDDAKLAYVRFTQFTPDSGDLLRKTLEGLVSQGMRGLILDLRFNGGGELQQAVSIANLFLRGGELVVTTRGRASPEYKRYTENGKTLPNFPVVLLVNEDTASASEIVAGALADHARALKDDPRPVVVVGARTFGKGSVQIAPNLADDNGTLKMTIAYWYTPSGRRVHRLPNADVWGVEPDVTVPLDEAGRNKLEDALAARTYMRRVGETIPRPDEVADDPQLAKAVEVLAAQLLPPPATQPTTKPQ
ncbi:MAG: S41 family peptidase [Tepidisphaeraceae bacterium]